MSDRTVDEDKRATLRRFAAAGAVMSTGLAGTAAGSSESDTREAILGYVTRTPGAHFSKIRDDLKLGTGETQYHLRYLLDENILIEEADGEYRRYFPVDRFDQRERIVLCYLRRDTPRRMLLALLETPGQSGVDLAATVGVARSTISAHMGGLVDAGLVTRRDGYHVQHPETVLTLILRYAQSFDADTVAFAQSADELLQYAPPS